MFNSRVVSDQEAVFFGHGSFVVLGHHVRSTFIASRYKYIMNEFRILHPLQSKLILKNAKNNCLDDKILVFALGTWIPQILIGNLCRLSLDNPRFLLETPRFII